MKKLCITIAILIGCIAGQAQTPNWNEWFRQKKTQIRYLKGQIVALKVYAEYLKKGYSIAQKGLTTIGDIKDGTFSLDKDYFNSLKQVSPVIKNSPKVHDIICLQQAIGKSFHKLNADCRDDENFTTAEIGYIEEVHQNMLTECDASIDELTMITTSGVAEMKDDERLFRLNKVHQDMQEKYAFTQDFVASTRLLSLQREKEKNQVKTVEKLYNNL